MSMHRRPHAGRAAGTRSPRLPAPRGVVMTMGALHDGHATLMRRARAECASVVATLFVNPLQFGAGEDLDRYPRTFDADVEICAGAGVDVLFAPGEAEMYPSGRPSTIVTAGPARRRARGRGAARALRRRPDRGAEAAQPDGT